jgi:hypothetical protein
MRRSLATDLAATLYAKRQKRIEPFFANTKFNRRIDRSNDAAEPPAAVNRA